MGYTGQFIFSCVLPTLSLLILDMFSTNQATNYIYTYVPKEKKLEKILVFEFAIVSKDFQFNNEINCLKLNLFQNRHRHTFFIERGYQNDSIKIKGHSVTHRCYLDTF